MKQFLFLLTLVLLANFTLFAQDQTYNFNGTSQYASVPHNSALNPSTFTIEAWALVTGGAGNYRAVVSSRGNYIGYILYAGADNNWQFWVGHGSEWTKVSGPAVTLNKWTHLAGVYSGGTMTFYVEGVSAGSASVTLSANTTGPFNIGAVDDNGSSPQFYLPGTVDEVRLWNTARSAAQIRANLFKDLSATESGLVADYKMDASGGTVYNSCTNVSGLNGSTVDGPNHDLSSIAYQQNALFFDGTNDYVEVANNSALQNSNFSVDLKAKRNSGGSGYETVLSYLGGNSHTGYAFYVHDNKWKLAYGNGSSYQYLIGPAVTNGSWTHLAASYNGTTLKFYVDGVEISSSNVTVAFNTTNSFYLGADYIGYYFNGKVDDVKMYNAAKSIGELTNNLHSIFDPTTATNLVAYYSFNQGLHEGSNGFLKTLYDNAGGHNGTITNFALSGSTSNFVQGAPVSTPGGVAGANLWLKANDGAANSGGSLTGWTDQTETNTFTKYGTIGYQANAVNFNPVVAISSTNTSDNPPDNRLEGNTNIQVADAFAVYIEDVQNVSGSLVGNSDGTFSGYMKGVFLGRDDSFYSQTDGASGLAGVSSSKIGVSYKLVNVDLSPATTPFWKLAQNGVELNPGAGSLTSFTSISIEPSIGGSDNPGGVGVTTFRHFKGKVAEILLYPTGLNATDKSKVESYLAIKYGISLGDNTNAVAYLSSSGATIWSADNTYKYDVFGIGKDDGSGLNQTQSNSINTGSGDGTGQSGKGNMVLSNPSTLTDGDFFLMGHDNGALTQQKTEVPVAGQRRIAREWLVKRTNDPGTVDLSFDISGLTLMGTTAADFKLLIDADGDFSSGATEVNAANLTGTKVSFTGLTIPDGRYLTIITGFLQPVGPGVLGANLWVKANEGTTSSGNNLTGWADQTGLNTFTVSGNPQTGSSKINFNNAIDFDGSGDWLTGNTAITFQTLYAVIKRNTTGNEGTVISVSGHSGSTNPGNVGYMIRGERMCGSTPYKLD